VPQQSHGIAYETAAEEPSAALGEAVQ
jgi:hypothetical protein